MKKNIKHAEKHHRIGNSDRIVHGHKERSTGKQRRRRQASRHTQTTENQAETDT